MKKLLVILLCAGAIVAQTENYNGWNDTSQIVNFKADSMKYSKVFLLSQNENLRIDMMADDSSATGYASDSVKFYWGIQLGHPTLNGTGSGTKDTFWSNELITLDTFNMRVTTNAATAYRLVDSTGTYTNAPQSHDTLSVTGFAVQSRQFSPAWDVYFRVWLKGLTLNKVGKWVECRVAVFRRIGVNTRSR
jgi:hypothetical protein